MKIRKFEFKDYAAKKPVTVSAKGEFLTASDVVADISLSLGSLFTLSSELQMKLTLERYKIEPDFKLGIIGVGVLTKNELIEHIRTKSDIGQLALRAEIGYCNELLTALKTNVITPWPSITDITDEKSPFWKTDKNCIYLRLRNRALFCENTTDSVTTPFANYRIANVHPVFEKRGYAVIVLQGTDDIRANFVPVAKSRLTAYISGVGHGNYTTYTGHWHDHILEVGNYDAAEVKGKAMHFLSCQTGAQLGPDTVANGSKAYAGYTENFILQWDDSSTPIDEFLLFAKCDSTFDIMMAKGSTAKQAYDATIRAFNAAISQVPNTVAATYLTWDRDHLKLHGTSASRIQPYRYVKFCFPVTNPATEEALAKAGNID